MATKPIFDLNQPAPAYLEALAEDANTGPISTAFANRHLQKRIDFLQK
ncbi:MAG: hypothetical protein F6K48_04650 [Okeania sp. SIO3H1]|nr:hypothetical protein [Okeania sp. SIO1I7]NEN88241.1 hypothetical protein [Okeania sp. SIO3H1]NET28911.1 hypothetical protein [Okeania sp. SIO1I7]